MYSYMSVFKASYAVTDPSARCRMSESNNCTQHMAHK